MRFALTVMFRLHPGRMADFLPHVIANAAESLRAEPGCRVFDVCRPLNGPTDAVFLYEVYDDRAAFDAHLRTSHFLRFDADVGPMVASKEITFLDLVSDD
jgi:quinol monooxygenase YgiN